jgi:hypothetical protein
VTDCHPNNPNLLDFDAGEWAFHRGMRERGLGGDCAVVFAVPHQGDHEWVVVFDDGAEDARVYVRWEGEDRDTWLESAPGVAMFFWDLAQTGLGWHQPTRHNGGKRVRRTDIGLSLES